MGVLAVLSQLLFLLAFVFSSSGGAPADLPRPAGQLALPAPYDQVDFWRTVKADASYQGLRGGSFLRTSTLYAQLQVFVGRSCTNASLPKVAVDAFQGFNQYEQMGDEYFDFLQHFNDCKPPHCSPIKSGILLIPVVVESRHHFVMAVIGASGEDLVDIRNQEIYLADSLNGGRKSSANAELLLKIREYVVKLLGAHGYATGSPREWAVGELVVWKSFEPERVILNAIFWNVPQQSNGVDCGVFDLLYADYFSRGLMPPFDFSQEHIPYFRRKMFKELNESSASHYTSKFGLIQCN